MLCTKRYSSDRKTKRDGWGIWCVWGRREAHEAFWLGNVTERDNWEYLGLDGEVVKCTRIFKNYGERRGMDSCGSGRGQVAGSF